MSNGVIYVSGSKNTKLAGTNKIDCTYTAIVNTCSSTCPIKNQCYAKLSFVGIINRRNEKQANGRSALEMAREEAKAIDNSYDGKQVPNGRMLRIHTSGDSRTIKGTKLISSAVKRWKKRGGGLCFSYTHSWHNVHRKHWKDVSVLASIESPSQIVQAREMGYPPALVVSEHQSDKAYQIGDTTFIPCPQQTRQVHCSECQLCMKGDWLYATHRGIAFAAHGVKTKELRRHLQVIQ